MANNAERRPSPEALLREAQQAEQGRLKIFLGAAPGVGKTYEMLTTARAKKAEGTDVVAGIAERMTARKQRRFCRGSKSSRAKRFPTGIMRSAKWTSTQFSPGGRD
jgi:K+-sensing histidine kinase KdpD